MILFPAIDIKNGECVRLRQGKYNDVTVFSKDPVEMAKHWVDKGAKYLHIVDLDGAFEGVPKNYNLIEKICNSIDIPVQLGGGIRNFDVARKYFDAGVTRLIIGTMFFEEPSIFKSLCDKYKGKIGVSLDAEKGKLKSRGWVEDTGLTIESVILDAENMGAGFIVYTDISKDGMQTGINPEPVKRFLSLTKLPVIYAGGVRDIDDVKRLYPLKEYGLQGIITGRAIYEGTLNFEEAIMWLETQNL
ncbi:1-(5-phosphoribosyl)-5-[(5-phosphoribosylamino) methylideneamino]imidazole-4-carboxamide isomerase [Desulfothermus naphthae]